MIELPASVDAEGKITYTRKFYVSPHLVEQKHFLLILYGVNYEAEFYINDTFIGKHTGGSSSFKFDVPADLIRPAGENLIKVNVSNMLGVKGTIPLRKQVFEWRNYNGIIRDVYLLAVPKTWIDEISVRPRYDASSGKGEIDIDAVITSHPHEMQTDSMLAEPPREAARLYTELFDFATGSPMGSAVSEPIILEPNREYRVKFGMQVASPRKWSPDSPDLYIVRTSLIRETPSGRARTLVRNTVDETSVTLGFREIQTSGNTFLINGIPTRIKGITWVEQHPAYGASLSPEAMERDVALIKMTGANAIHFAFHPPHPFMLDLCSRYGLLAFVDLPLANLPSQFLSEEAFNNLSQNIVSEIVERDINQPSLSAWGIVSRVDETDLVSVRFVESVASTIRRNDNRLLYVTSVAAPSPEIIDLTDFAALVSLGAGIRDLKELVKETKSVAGGKPVLLMSYGTLVEPGNRNGYSDPASHESQARFFLQMSSAIKDAGIAGGFAFAFADFRGDRPSVIVRTDDKYYYPVGLMSEQREKRIAYDILRSLYKDERVGAIPIGNYRASFPFIHILIGLALIVLVAYQYNYNRRFSDTMKRAFLHPYNFFADVRDLRSVSSWQTFMLALIVAVTFGLIFSATLRHFRSSYWFDYLLTFLLPWDNVKEFIIRAAWSPITATVGGALILLTSFVLIALLLRVIASFTWKRIRFWHTWVTVVWSALPMVALSVVGILMFKVLETPAYVIPTFAVVLSLFFWSLIRFLAGTAILFERAYVRIYTAGILVVLVTCGGALAYYSYTYAILPYLKLFVGLQGL